MLLNRINAEIAAEREHIRGPNEEARQKAAEKLEKQSSQTGAANTQKKQSFKHRDQLHPDFVKASIPPLTLRIQKKKTKTNINTDPDNTIIHQRPQSVHRQPHHQPVWQVSKVAEAEARTFFLRTCRRQVTRVVNEPEQSSESEAGGDDEVEADDEEDEEEAMYEEYEEGRRSNRRLENLFKSQRQILFLFIFYPILSFSM